MGVFDAEDRHAMRLGLFGGTFDPIHLGHLILAEACREACRLDRLWFVVSGEPPHKGRDRTSVNHRLEMARIAVAGNPAFEVSEREAHTPGPHYSYKTLEAIQAERPEDELFFLIGADSLVDLPGWRKPDRILSLATLVVVNRPGVATDQAESSAAALVSDLGVAPRIVRVDVPGIGISSTDLRDRLATGRSIRYQVPRGVEAYIQAHGLYQQPTEGEARA